MLADAIREVLPVLRAEAEAMMVDSCTITRADGGTAMDPVTLEEVPTYAAVWSGKCRVQRSGALSPREQSGAAGFEFGIDSLLIQLPLSATGIKRGDVLTVTDATTDPDLLDVKATVQANMAKTHATKRTLVCEEVK